MKTKYLIPAMLLLMLAGCYKEQTPVEEGSVPRKGTFNFSSSTGEVTKVLLNSDNTLFWAAGDQIAVYDYKGETLVQSDVAALSGGEGTGVGTFTPTNHTSNTDWFVGGDASDQAYNFYAFYPGAAAEPSSKVVAVNVAAEQKQSQGVGKYIISYAAANTTKSVLASASAPNFAFAPKSALLKLTIRNNADIPVRISSVQISSSVNIAGNASLNLGTGVLSDGDATAITYTFANPIEVAAGAVASAPVYISMLPCAPGSLSVTLNQAGFAYTVADINLATIESGHVYAKEAAISSVSRELAISNGNTSNLANAAEMDEDVTLYYGTTNCVVMDVNDNYCVIPIGVYKSDDGYTRSNSSAGKNTAVKKAKVIWAEKGLYEDPNFCVASGTTGMLTVTKSAGVTGNALIGIYDEDGGLLWSYHVWCPFDKSTLSVTSEGTSTEFSAFKLALGQITGADCDTYMFYQWGRKDPLGRANPGFIVNDLLTVYGESIPSTGNYISAKATGESENNLSYARKNPTKFITQNDTKLYDWYPAAPAAAARTDANKPNGQNDNLWVTTKATIFDPCPPGYRVAPKTLWDGSKGKGAGPLFESAGLWYVLGGARHSANAGVNTVASWGYYWPSEAVGGDSNCSYFLFFNSGNYLLRAHADYRASAFGVRCVKGGPISPYGSKVIENSTDQTAKSAVLEANNLYYGTANSVLVDKTATSISVNIQLFKSADGYARSAASASPFTSAVTSAKIIWTESGLSSDANFKITGGDLATLTLSKTANTTGNALVGIYDADGRILWSYHIWVPEDASEVVPSANVTGSTSTQYSKALKLALGQITSSHDTYMYYQWGRKDPLGRANSLATGNTLMSTSGDGPSVDKKISALATGHSGNNLAYARQNPTMYILLAGSGTDDWYPTADVADANHRNDNLWNETATIYDPCPAGYHVPGKNRLWRAVNSDSGYSASADQKKSLEDNKYFSLLGVDYVRGGFREREDAGVYLVASGGCYWSCGVTTGVTPYHLYFNDSTVYPAGDYGGRARGFGVRCVKD